MLYFNLVLKQSPVFFLAEVLLFPFVVFVEHALMFCPHFSQKQSAKCSPKKIQGNVLLLS